MKTRPALLLQTLATVIALSASAGIAADPEKPEGKDRAAKQEKGQDKEKPKRPARPKPPRPPRLVPLPGKDDKAAPRTVRRVWLGVATAPVAPEIREYLELAEGFGVQVEFVAPDSPAAVAGLRPRDILTQLDDQLLTTPDHLAVLVRSQEKGDRVTLTLLRKGAEKTLDATLGEHDAPVHPGAGWEHPLGFRLPRDPDNARRWEESIRKYQDKIREGMEKYQSHRFPHPRPPAADGDKDGADDGKPALPLPPKFTKPVPSPGSKPKPATAAKPPAISLRPGFPIGIFSGAGLIRIDNAEGEVTIQVKDGKHSIKIVNADGDTVYEGDYDPAKGAKGLPKEARAQLKKMKLDDLKLLGVPMPGTKKGSRAEIRIEIGADVTPAPRNPGKVKEGAL